MPLNPFYFGESARQLFGMYDAPRGGGRRGAVVCYPWGQEYLKAHQAVRHLARLLARRGVHAMRFDYYGCGDSAGDDTEGSVSQWQQDVGTALDELKDIAGLRSVSLVGLRFGAALAVACAASRRDVDRLVLWDPIFDGRAYVDELIGAAAGPKADRAVQVHGFPLTEPVRRAMGGVSLEEFRRVRPPALIVSTVEADSYAPLERVLLEAGVDAATAHRPGPRVWEQKMEFASAGMPVAALEEIARWLAS